MKIGQNAANLRQSLVSSNYGISMKIFLGVLSIAAGFITFCAMAQDMPNLFEIDLYNSHSMVEITGHMPVRGNNEYELDIVEYGARDHDKDKVAVLLIAPDGDRAVLEVGSGMGIEIVCEWKNSSKNRNDHLVGLVNPKSIPQKHYLNPYKAWLVEIDQSPPRFMPVKANLVRCYGGAVD